mgnify:FL=1
MKKTFEEYWEVEALRGKGVVPKHLWNDDRFDEGIHDEELDDIWEAEGEYAGFEEGAIQAGDEPFEGVEDE